MSITDIIPDIHGQAGKLRHALAILLTEVPKTRRSSGS
jgi:hypothetical protein